MGKREAQPTKAAVAPSRPAKVAKQAVAVEPPAKHAKVAKQAIAVEPPAKHAKAAKQAVAVEPPAKHAKVAKEAVVVEPVVEVVDPFTEKCNIVKQAIEKVENLSVGTKEVMLAAIPFCFRSEPAARHAYERTVIEAIAQCLHGEEAKRQGVVAAVQSEISSETAEVDQMKAAMEGQLMTVKELNEKKEGKEAAFKEAERVARAAEGVLEEAKANVLALTEERKKQEAEKEEFTKVKETFASLRAGTVGEGEGDDTTKTSHLRLYHEKKKLVTTMMKQLPRTDMPKSLLPALDVALRVAPDQRGKFCAAALEHGDTALDEFLQGLDAKMGSYEGEFSSRSALVEDAQSKLDAVAVDKRAAQDLADAAGNAWVDEQEKMTTMQSKIDACGGRAKELNSLLNEAQAHFQVFDSFAKTFGVLKEYGTQEPPAPVPEPVAEEATAEANTNEATDVAMDVASAEVADKAEAEVVSMEADPPASVEVEPAAVVEKAAEAEVVMAEEAAAVEAVQEPAAVEA